LKTDQNIILDEIISLALQEQDLTKDSFHKVQNGVYKKHKLKRPIPSIQILQRYNELVSKGIYIENIPFKKVLRKRGVRSLSGVSVISLLTKFFGCPGKCVYCPTFDDLPKSYIPNEPAVMRAQLNVFDPILQIHNRLRSLEITGHKIEKNDIRIIGWTWSVYPKDYQESFIKGIYDACNTYSEMKGFIEDTDLQKDKFASFKIKESYIAKASPDIETAKKLNESTSCRIIWIAIETRPDWLDVAEIKRLRRFGVTRVEIGYQTTDDEINELNKRGHGNKESIEATRLLKDAGMKVVAHMMPNLLWSTPDIDRSSMKEVFENSDFRPDELKIYPMMVTDKSELTQIWKDGGFIAYDDETLIDLMCDLEAMVPEYIRINRTYRDIPATEILHGSTLSNLRQIVEERLKKKGIKMLEIRAREIKDKINDPQNAVLHIFEYDASGGKEYFLTYEDPVDRTIFSLLRLRIPSWYFEIHPIKISSHSHPDENQDLSKTKTGISATNKKLFELLPELEWCAIVREIHTFGDQLSIGEKWSTFGQHIGFGKRLMEKAEEIAKEKYGIEKMAVIAWVGVRKYYEKRGYVL
jgi:elongator complex protein 3